MRISSLDIAGQPRRSDSPGSTRTASTVRSAAQESSELILLEALTSVAANAVFLVLLIAFAEHLRSPGAMARALTAQAALPGALVRPAAVASTAAEGALTMLLGFLLFTEGPPAALPAALAAACALLALYAAYSVHLLRTSGGRTVPCGCSSTDTPISGWVIFRASALSAVALLAAVRADTIVGPAESATRFAEAALPGAVLAVLLWVLPEAMLDPAKGPGRGL